MNPCILIPHFNHDRQFVKLVAQLDALALPVLVMDDGSDPASFTRLQASLAGRRYFSVYRDQCNRGKGATVMRGLRLADSLGYTHVVQIDADGQHCVGDIPVMLEAVRQDPAVLVSGNPVYDESVPLVRLQGRKISRFWTQVETWSRDIRDPLCGFRVYPVVETLGLFIGREPGPGMEFDAEVLVRASWAGIPLCFVPTRVIYPQGGVSHFRMVRDNLKISIMHTRLFFGMVRRIPVLVARRLKRSAR